MSADPRPVAGELTIDEVLERIAIIEDYDPGGGPGPCVHTIAKSVIAIGAHWYVKDVVAAMADGATARNAAGPFGHTIALDRDDVTVFLEVKAP